MEPAGCTACVAAEAVLEDVHTWYEALGAGIGPAAEAEGSPCRQVVAVDIGRQMRSQWDPKDQRFRKRIQSARVTRGGAMTGQVAATK